MCCDNAQYELLWGRGGVSELLVVRGGWRRRRQYGEPLGEKLLVHHQHRVLAPDVGQQAPTLIPLWRLDLKLDRRSGRRQDRQSRGRLRAEAVGRSRRG